MLNTTKKLSTPICICTEQEVEQHLNQKQIEMFVRWHLALQAKNIDQIDDEFSTPYTVNGFDFVVTTCFSVDMIGVHVPAKGV